MAGPGDHKVLLTGLAALIVLAIPAIPEAQDLGRLFLTPPERAYLDRLRQEALNPQPVLEVVPEREPATEPPADTVVEVRIYRYEGSLRRGDGGYTVWLNAQYYEVDQLPQNISLVQPYEQGLLRIRDPDSGRDYRLKPGQVLDLSTGRLLESYQAPQAGIEANDDGASDGRDDEG